MHKGAWALTISSDFWVLPRSSRGVGMVLVVNYVARSCRSKGVSWAAARRSRMRCYGTFYNPCVIRHLACQGVCPLCVNSSCSVLEPSSRAGTGNDLLRGKADLVNGCRPQPTEPLLTLNLQVKIRAMRGGRRGHR